MIFFRDFAYIAVVKKHIATTENELCLIPGVYLFLILCLFPSKKKGATDLENTFDKALKWGIEDWNLSKYHMDALLRSRVPFNGEKLYTFYSLKYPPK